MASLSINTETIALRDQPVERFRELAGMMTSRLPGLFEQPKEQRFIGQLPAGFIHGRLAEGGEYAEPLMQVALWNLFDLGVREMAINQESKSVNITKSEHTDCALGRASWISHQTVTSGRAMIAALNCIAHRTFRLNDAEVTVGVQKMEPMKQAITIIKARKKAEESPLFATVRVMASILGKKMGVETTEMRCLIELSAGMGLVAVSIDPDKNQIAFRAFSEMSALATALLQGAEWERVKTIRKQLSELSAQASGGNQPAAQGSYDPTSIKRRRRG